MNSAKFIAFLLLAVSTVFGQTNTKDSSRKSQSKLPSSLNLPKRAKNAFGGNELVRKLTDLSVEEREFIISQEIKSGNVTAFCRVLKPIKITEIIEGNRHELTFFATADYLAVGSENDYFYVPLTPTVAQTIANDLQCLLPTKKMVDAAYENATVKLRPQPIPPSETMTTIPVFWQHSDSVKLQLKQLDFRRKGNQLVAGHKKDVIISKKIHDKERTSDKVVIYGWHKAENKPIQPVYAGHGATYADYSHGVRLVLETAILDGKSVKIIDILDDARFAILLSDEGIISKPYYPLKQD